MADTRVLELINKRVLQFDGIMGMSDDVVGNFADNATDGVVRAFEAARHKTEIEYRASLASHENANKDEVTEAENILFTTFTRDIANKITVTPKYIKDRTEEINTKLWELVANLLAEHGYIVDNSTLTATLPPGTNPPQLFYY